MRIFMIGESLRSCWAAVQLTKCSVSAGQLAAGLMAAASLGACGLSLDRQQHLQKSSSNALVDLSPAQPEPLRLEPGNHQPQSLPLETQFRGRDLPSGRIDFATTERPDGTLNIRVTGRGTLVVTSDGTIPDRNNPSDSTIIAENSVELVITNPTILRAKSYDERGASTLRSKSFVPRLVELSLRQLPRNADVTGVYVTGPFRGWSSALEEPYRLQRNPEGNYRIRLKDTGPQREGRFLYKFLLKLRNGETLWWLDPAAPQTGVGEFANNFAPSNLEMLANKFLRNTPGFIEEAALDLRLQPVAALDQGDGIVRISLGFLENDVESVTIKFLNGQTANLQKSSYRRENISYDRFSGLVALPEGNTSSGFVLAVQDGSARLRVGSTGILGTDESLTDGNTFPFAYDSEASTLNGQDIYQVPLWSVDANWYQIFPERFRNGDTSNDRAFIPQAWQAQLKQAGINIKPELREWTSDWFVFSAFEQKLAQAVTGRLPNTTERDIQREIVLGRRYGGDLEGIRQQIQYLKSLNINAVYLNPVFDSDSNHKYDTKDYRHVDRYFGPMRKASFGADPELYPDDERLLRREDLLDPSTWEFTRADKLFVKLVNELQANGIRVVIDGVYNHSASSSLFMEDIAKRGRASRFYPWFEMAALGDSDFPAKKCNLSEFYPDRNLYPEASKIGYDAWFGYCTLPNHREGYPDTVLHPELAEHIFNVTKRWLGPQEIDGIPFAGVDGVRLDVYGDINQDYWRLYRKQVKSIKKDALIIAEEWYDGFDILKGDQTDVLMNYTVRTLAEGWFINTNAQERFRPSQASGYADFRLNNQRDHVRYALWSMLDSHDTDRMMSKTLFRNRGLSPRPQDGNSWDDGSVNRPDLGAPYSNDAPGPAEIEFFKGIIGFQTAYMGSPMLYYGNEQGMWGSDDPTCRKPMMWPDLFLGGDYETRCVTNSGLWCQLDQQTRFEMRPNADLFATYQRLFRARTNSNALRRGSLKTQLQVIVDGRNLTTGVQSSDYLWLWGFERAFAGREFAYFLSNQNNSRQALSVSLATRFQPGQPIVDLLSGAELTADSAGWVTLDIPRERAVLLIEKTALGL